MQDFWNFRSFQKYFFMNIHGGISWGYIELLEAECVTCPFPTLGKRTKNRGKGGLDHKVSRQSLCFRSSYDVGLPPITPKKCIKHQKLQWKINLLSMPEYPSWQDHFRNDSGEDIGIGCGLNFTNPLFTTPPPSPIAVTVSNPNLHFPRPINTRHSWTGGRKAHQNGTRNSPALRKIIF